MTDKTKKNAADCAKCDKPNNSEDMVQCDACKKWYHYSCAGVDSSVADRSFECVACAELNETVRGNVASVDANDDRMMSGSKGPSVQRSVSATAHSARISVASSSRKKLELELKRLEEEKKLDMQLIVERQQKEKEYLIKRYELLAQEDDNSSTEGESCLGKSRTSEWVDQVRAKGAPEDLKTGAVIQAELVPKVAVEEVPEVGLSRSQISARQVLSKELPVFSGRPEDWPLFISSFENSTRICGFTNEENLWRLQRALKGNALEAVRARLLLPSMVSEIISTLRMRYGRPEYIVHTLLVKIRSEPPPKADRLDTLVNFALSVRNLYGTMEASGLKSHLNNPVLLQELVEKLPASIRLNWALHRGTAELNLADFGDWLYKMAEAASSVTAFPPTDGKSERRQAGLHAHSEMQKTRNIQSSSRGRCFVCGADHRLLDCGQFRSLPIWKRWEVVRGNGICEICLAHRKSSKCRSSSNGSCHSLLQTEEQVNQKACMAHQRSDGVNTVFRIVPVMLYGNGKSIETYAFLDSGSSLTLVEQNIADTLGLKGIAKPLCLKWTAETVRYEEASEVVPMEISSRGQIDEDLGHKYRLQDVRTVENLALPRQTVQAEAVHRQYPHLRSVPLVTFEKARCGILIGLNNQKLTLALKTKEGKWNDPVALKTRLGWCLSGGDASGVENSGVYHIYKACDCNRELDELVRQHYTLEDQGIESACYETAEDVRARKILKETVHRKGDSFVSGLLWRYDNVIMPDSFPMALKRLTCLEKKCIKDPRLLNVVNDQVKNLVDKGYARKLNQHEQGVQHPRVWYLPTFMVRNQNKPDKKRMVWDAAASTQGVSLNSMLLKGPDELKALTDVLYAFRVNKIAIAGDIQEMFHQVGVREQDQHCQRFLWRGGESSCEPEVYIMKVLTFGATCSPSIAQYVKNINAMEYADIFPRAAEAIIDHHYVDDMLDSVDTIEDAIQLAKDVKYIHARAGFNIRNWLSNSRNVLRALDEPEDRETKMIDNIGEGARTMKVLGLWWNTREDFLGFSLQFVKMQEDIMKGSRMPTKRELLRVLMSIFDPLGFLAFYLVRLKVLQQEVWRSAIGWDDVIPQELHEKWDSWRRLLTKVEEVRIPRCYFPDGFCKKARIQLHVFVDASEDAMAAVAYLRFMESGVIRCALVCAKSKVAPLKPTSIPRLELQAAVLGSRIANSVLRTHAGKLKIERRYLWTDSKNVISWLRSDAKKFKPFVMFRVADILQRTKLDEWNWVPTKLNVADEATKWSKEPSFGKDVRWFCGPDFLYEGEETWPAMPGETEHYKEEMRPKYLLATHFNYDGPLVDADRFSSWTRLQRSMARVLRFIGNTKSRIFGHLTNNGVLTADELHRSEQILFQMAQKEKFGDDYAMLLAGKTLSKGNCLYKLSAYMDENGVLRMRGRIDGAWCVDEGTKRPVILPRDHRITFLIVRMYHLKFHHKCQETVVNEVKQRFWIASLRPLVKSVRRKCQWCRYLRAEPVVPEMSPLPEARLAAYTRPFSYVGVDYFGPMLINVCRRSEKRWGVIFTCLTVRAVHIEMAHTLSTDSCIMCIRNFMARRGIPREIYSDNGTNLKGAERELREAFHQIDCNRIQEKFTSSDTKWYFNPPAAPHMGGAWERLVGSIKNVLKGLMRNQRLTDESLQSMLIEVEGIINSRPLTHVSVECDDLEALTPNHFLLGSSNGSKPPGQFCDKDLILRKEWRKCQQFTNLFWKRWVQEYLPTLTRRTKWFQNVKKIEEGDIVIVVDENLPRGVWPKGLVVGVTRANDGQIRRATVKTANGLYVRPVARLAVLDVRKEYGEAAAETAVSPEGGNVADSAFR